MKKYKYKLETVLKYRMVLEKLAKNDYLKELSRLNFEKEKLLNLINVKNEIIENFDPSNKEKFNSDELVFFNNYLKQLLYLIEEQKKVIEEHNEVVKEKFNEWNEKRKGVKVLEKLKEKDFKLWLKEFDKEEQKFVDEVFIGKYVRGMNNEK